MKIFKIVLLILVPFIGFAHDKIIITTGEWTPYSSQTLKHNGVVCRITTEAFDLAGIEVEWQFLSWKRAYEVAKNGITADGSIFWYYNPERAKDFYFSEQIASQSNVFFHLKDYEFDWDNYSDLKGLKIGTTSGYSYGTKFDEAVEKGILEIEQSNSDTLNFKMLLAGRIKLFPIQMDIGYDLLHRLFSPDEVNLITYNPKYINSEPVYLILNNKNEKNLEYIKRFNRGLIILKANGKYDKYYQEVAQGYYSKK